MFPAGFEPTPRQESQALDLSAMLVRYQLEHLYCNSILIYEYRWMCDNTCMESVMVWCPMQSSVNNYYTSKIYIEIKIESLV